MAMTQTAWGNARRGADGLRQRFGSVRRRTAALDALVAAAGVWLAVLLVAAIAAPWIAEDPNAVDPVMRLSPPGTPGHLLGTDNLGRDLLSRLLHGTPYSLAYALVPGGVALAVGGTIGLFAGFGGRVLNAAIMRTVDVFYAFPPILIALAIVGALGPGFVNCLLALTVYLVFPVIRVTESATVQVRSLGFVQAARLSGASTPMILFVQILPNVLPAVLAYVTSVLGIMIMIGAGLSFLGIGASTPTPEWGLMLNELRTAIFANPLVATIPGVFIFLTSFSLNILGEALQRRWSLRRV